MNIKNILDMNKEELQEIVKGNNARFGTVEDNKTDDDIDRGAYRECITKEIDTGNYYCIDYYELPVESEVANMTTEKMSVYQVQEVLKTIPARIITMWELVGKCKEL